MIDLRSDTVTQPHEAMLDAMQSATFGDDSRDGDATVMKLEALAAKRRKEAGAIHAERHHVQSRRHARAWRPRRRGAGGGRLAHAQRRAWRHLRRRGPVLPRDSGQRGAMDLDLLREAVRPTTRNQMGTALIWIENTHNRAAARCCRLPHMQAVRDSHVITLCPCTSTARAFSMPPPRSARPRRMSRNTRTRFSSLRLQGTVGAGRFRVVRRSQIHRARPRLSPHGRRQHAPIRTARRRRHRRVRKHGRALPRITAPRSGCGGFAQNRRKHRRSGGRWKPILVRVSVHASGRKRRKWSRR